MVESPCKNTENSCKLNENDRCKTCNRTVQDIIQWSQMDEKEQIKRMKELKEKFD